MLKCNWDLLVSTTSVILTPLLMELDEQWSYVGKKQQQRWLWLAICHKTSQIVAYCFGRRTHESFELLLKTLRHFKVGLFFSQGASGLIIDFGTSKSAKIESLPSAVYSFGRHGSLSSRLRRKLRILLRHLAPVCLYGVKI